jgi:hypothetical protein
METGALARQLTRDRFGSFALTEAIRSAEVRGIIPQEGYRLQTYRDPERRLRLPVLTAAISRERLFDAFLALLSPLGPVVDLILESSHENGDNEPVEFEREVIDLPILTSTCYDFEDLLLNDGCTGIAVLNEDRRIEVHFDEHKLLYVYAPRLSPFELILSEYAVKRADNLRIITEGEHVHCTQTRYADEFETFRNRLGALAFADQWS